MKYLKFVYWIFLLLLLGACVPATAQELVPAAGDTTKRIHVLNNTKRLTLQTVDDSTKLTIVTGDVKLRQGNTLIFCDSCILNSRTNLFEAWGRVHIKDADTADIYSNHLRYLGNEKKAYLDGNVKLTDGKGTLTTPDLEYDMETNIGIYMHGGKVVNGKTVLNSKEGWYYADTKDVYFKRDVVLVDPAYNIKTDSLLYNTATRATRFIAETTIIDSSGTVIKTKEGFVNQATGEAQFGRRPTIYDKKNKVTVTGETITQTDTIMRVQGNAVIIDSVQGTTIIGGMVIRNKLTEAILATQKPLMIVKQENDSIYITADTLFTAKLTDKFGRDSIITDSVKGTKIARINDKDSSNRYFEAFRNVRIFNDSLQAACDSMFYSFQDSVFRLYDDPVVWSQNSQITGDTILLFTKNKKPEKVEAFDNGFMVNEVEPGVYNQIKSTRIDGWFLEGNIDSVRARGFAECVYYIQDEDSAYTGANQSTSDIIDIYFEEKQLDKVVFRSAVSGTIWPLSQKSPSELQLANFRWLESRRPKTKYDLFE